MPKCLNDENLTEGASTSSGMAQQQPLPRGTLEARQRNCSIASRRLVYDAAARDLACSSPNVGCRQWVRHTGTVHGVISFELVSTVGCGMKQPALE